MARSDREDSVLFRLSRAQKQHLKHEAAELGISVQALMERRVLGIRDAEPHPPGRQPAMQRERLDIAV